MLIPRQPHEIIWVFSAFLAASETPLVCYIGGLEPLTLDAHDALS